MTEWHAVLKQQNEFEKAERAWKKGHSIVKAQRVPDEVLFVVLARTTRMGCRQKRKGAHAGRFVPRGGNHASVPWIYSNVKEPLILSRGKRGMLAKDIL